MADEGVQFQFSASIEQLLTALTDAQSSMETAFSGMESKIEEMSGHFDSAFKEITEGSSSVKTSFADMGEGLMAAFKFDVISQAVSQAKQFAEQIERIAERGTEIRNMSEILGLTAEQFQALSLSAETAGVSTQMLMRSGVRLEEMFQQAASGAQQAQDGLLKLGFTADQWNDKAFTTNDILGQLHDRLLDANLATSTQAELMQLFGARAALVVEAIKSYDGSQAAVAGHMAEVNGLTAQQAEQLHSTAAAFKEAGTWIANASGKLLIYAEDAAKAVLASGELLAAADATVAPTETAGDVAARVGDKYKGFADEVRSMTIALQQANIESTKVEVEGARAGTDARLAALQQYHAALVDLYGENNAEVKRVDAEIVASERDLADKRANFLEEWANKYQEITTRNAMSAMEANIRVERDDNEATKLREKQIEELSKFAENLDLQVTKEHAKSLQEMAKADKASLDTRLAEWKTMSKGLESAMDSAIKGMLAGTESFGQAMRNIFMSVLNSIIDKLLHDFLTSWIEAFIEARIANKMAAVGQVSSNASVAATAAMASVAAIPFYGWAMAPGVGAETYATALTYAAMPSAAGGWEVPNDTVAMVHKDEKILPAATSKGIDDMIKSGGAGRAIGRMPNITFNVPAMDARSFKNFAHQREIQGALTGAIMRAYRRGAR